MGLLLVAIVLLGASGVAGLFLGYRSSLGQRAATLLLLVGAGVGLIGVGRCLFRDESVILDVPWLLPWGSFRLKADSLASFFLAPVFLIPAFGSVYGLGY